MIRRAPKALFILVDGLGIGLKDPDRNPVRYGVCPFLCGLLDGYAVPVDASMGVPGIPQSATGQTALFTGINAAREVGRHVEGFPGPVLREIIRGHNVYDILVRRGYCCTFANAYYLDDVEEVRHRRHQSVTTVAALKAFGTVRGRQEMLQGRAVYQDLTRVSLRERGYDGPLTSPAQSGRDLVSIARDHDFTVFEYFQTDRVAHKGTPKDVRAILAQFDAFLREAAGFAAEDPDHLLLLTSDHGNIEEARSPSHSINPVPLVAIGRGAEQLRDEVHSLPDFVPSLLRLYPAPGASLVAC